MEDSRGAYQSRRRGQAAEKKTAGGSVRTVIGVAPRFRGSRAHVPNLQPTGVVDDVFVNPQLLL
jgi:hypothetical protein